MEARKNIICSGESKIKASIITAAPHVRNYGSVLLSYATCKLFEKKGFSTEIVDYTRHSLEEAESFSELVMAIKARNQFNKFPFFLCKCIAFAIYPSIKMQLTSFKPFIKKYLDVSVSKYDSEQALIKNPPEADIYCTGGDQMWNEQHNGHRTLGSFYLSYAPEGKPRISFSTSIGKEHFDAWEVPEVVPLLKKYDMISVRESSAKTTLSNIGINNAVVLLDPVLLLNSAEWEAITSRRIIQEPYILVYEMSKRTSLELSKAAKIISKATGKKIVRISKYSVEKLQSGMSIQTPSPSDFLSLIKYADYIVTNSFHGVAFSIVFRKNFVYLAGANPTRIKNLLARLGLNKQIILDADSATVCCSYPANYTVAEKQIKIAQADCDKYLDTALKLAIAKKENSN